MYLPAWRWHSTSDAADGLPRSCGRQPKKNNQKTTPLSESKQMARCLPNCDFQMSTGRTCRVPFTSKSSRVFCSQASPKSETWQLKSDSCDEWQMLVQWPSVPLGSLFFHRFGEMHENASRIGSIVSFNLFCFAVCGRPRACSAADRSRRQPSVR